MEFFEIHSLDVIQLWYMDQPERIRNTIVILTNLWKNYTLGVESPM